MDENMNPEHNYLSSSPWVNEEFVQNLIQNYENNQNVSVVSYTGVNALSGGENFPSSMIRLSVIYERDHNILEQTFIIKKALETERMSQVCEESAIFEKEIEVYTKILPEINNLFGTIGIDCQIGPKTYFNDLNRRVIVLEDLTAHQFENVDKANGLDNEHMKSVLITLAKWHASTAVLILKKPEIFTEHKKKQWYKDDVIVRDLFKGIAKTASNAVQKWDGFERIADKLVNIPTENGFNVLAHGDMWSNNIMFRHNENGKPIDVRFIDYALGKHMNAGLDLACLLYGCLHQSQRQKDREELIQFYHAELITLLKKLNFPQRLPTLFDIQSAVFRVDLFNALVILLIIGIRYVEKSREFTALVDGDHMNQMYSHPECVEKMKYLLQLFDRRGYFDFIDE